VGSTEWTHSEPPLTIGRGLLVTTGAIGGLLSLVVLWAMLPSTGRGGVAGPTVATSSANDLAGSIITARPDTLVATSVDLRLPSTTLRSNSLNAPAAQESTTTTFDHPQATATPQRTDFIELAPMAVSIADTLLLTTAQAVEGRTSLTVTGADGLPHDATVVMVDSRLGLAVLSADAAATTSPYAIGAAANPGDVVTVLGSTPTVANVSVDADGHLTLDTWTTSMAEGTPVLNADGQLVGMCSHGVSGPSLISVASVAGMLQSTKPGQPAAWLGIHAGESGAASVGGVDANGPADAAGIAIGDIITAIDGVAVTDFDDLKAAIAEYAPGDVVTLTITHVDQTASDITVTLGTTPSI
jgi:S1-C subfamily serine protease